MCVLEKEAVNLKESRRWYMGRFEGKNGKERII